MQKMIRSNPIRILFIFIILNLVIGLLIVPDYGISTDESAEEQRSKLALEIYTIEIEGDPIQAYEDLGLVKYYGTASSVLFRFFEFFIFPNQNHTKNIVAHYGYFVFFQAAIVAMYLLAKNFFDEWLSLGIALLFGTQPLLFGHAFINPKDIPLLTVFLFTIVTGFRMVDSWRQNGFDEQVLSKKTQRKFNLIFFSVLIAIFMILWFNSWIRDQFLAIVEYSYQTQDSTLIGKLFGSLTTYGSLEGYLRLADFHYLRVFRWGVFASLIILFVLFRFAQKKKLFEKRVNLLVLIAAAVLGFSISTRVIAIAAWGLIGLYGLIRLRSKAVIPLLIYTIAGSLFSFITWPFLWFFGLPGLIESIIKFSTFPKIGYVQFEGQLFLPNDLPANYIPKLMAFQFTEPLVVLTILGCFAGFYFLFQRKENRIKLILVYCWFFLPLFYTIIGQGARYNNFRQFLFISTPLFIFAGIALQCISSLIMKKEWLLIFFLVILAPGVIPLVQLHPYQYIYYNEFIGGVEGAYRKYELDYWMTSYKEAMEYVNANITSGSNILVWIDDNRARMYAEKLFSFSADAEVTEEEYHNFDYAIIPTRRFADQLYFPDKPVIYSATIDKATLVVIKKINSDID